MSDGSKVCWWPASLLGTCAAVRLGDWGIAPGQSSASLEETSVGATPGLCEKLMCLVPAENGHLVHLSPRCRRSQHPVLSGDPPALLESVEFWVGAGHNLPEQDADPINFSRGGGGKALDSSAHLHVTKSK